MPETVTKDRTQIRMEVKIPTPTMLKVLWITNMQKGKLAIDAENELPKAKLVTVALVMMAETIEFEATVLTSTPKTKGKGYFVNVEFQITAGLREAIEKITGSIRDHKTKKKKHLDDTDIDLGE